MSKAILFLGQYDKKNVRGRLFARVRDTCSREHLAIRPHAEEMVTYFDIWTKVKSSPTMYFYKGFFLKTDFSEIYNFAIYL